MCYALAVLAEGGQHTIGFMLDNLYLADARQINPFTAGDVLCQRLEVALNRFAAAVELLQHSR